MNLQAKGTYPHDENKSLRNNTRDRNIHSKISSIKRARSEQGRVCSSLPKSCKENCFRVLFSLSLSTHTHTHTHKIRLKSRNVIVTRGGETEHETWHAARLISAHTLHRDRKHCTYACIHLRWIILRYCPKGGREGQGEKNERERETGWKDRGKNARAVGRVLAESLAWLRRR